MSKRFTETEKWKDPWFRKLTPLQKCLFLFIVDNCNNAGFIEIDIEGWAMCICCKHKDLEGAWEGIGRGLIIAGGWAYVRCFLKHQKHLPLCPDRNRAHTQIVGFFGEQEGRFPGLLQKIINGSPMLAPDEGLGRGAGIGIGKGKGIGKEVDAGFDEFWAAYPNKKGKTAAAKAWGKAPLRPDIATILAAIASQKTWPEWTKDGGQYIPHPATWINQGRWDDQPHAPGSTRTPVIPAPPLLTAEERRAIAEARGG